MPRRSALIAVSLLIVAFAFFLNVQFLLPAFAQTPQWTLFKTSRTGFVFRSSTSTNMVSLLGFSQQPYLQLYKQNAGEVNLKPATDATGDHYAALFSLNSANRTKYAVLRFYPSGTFWIDAVNGTAVTLGRIMSASPVSNSDVATKEYVDLKAGNTCQMRGGKAARGLRDTIKRFNISPAFPTNVSPIVLLTPTGYAGGFRVSNVSYSYFDASFQQNTDFFWLALDPATCF